MDNKDLEKNTVECEAEKESETLETETVEAEAVDTTENLESDAAESVTVEDANSSDCNKEKKDKKDLQIEELTDKYKRTMAEFDNFRKRTEKEKSAMYEIGVKDMVEKILPVVDNFERGLAGVSEEERTAFVDGMDMVYKQLVKMLEDAGVTAIEALGCEFDPNLHNAVMHIEDENFGENIVAEEFQKGYKYRDYVVRHSVVKVAN